MGKRSPRLRSVLRDETVSINVKYKTLRSVLSEKKKRARYFQTIKKKKRSNVNNKNCNSQIANVFAVLYPRYLARFNDEIRSPSNRYLS